MTNSQRLGGKRVLLGYEQIGADHIRIVPPNESRTHEQRVLVAKMEKALALLPPKRSDLLRRVFWERQTQAEIADDLGISQQAVAGRIKTAKKQFQKVWQLCRDLEIEEDEL